MKIRPINSDAPKSSQEVIDHLRALLRMAYKHEFLWLEVDGLVLTPNSEQYVEYSWPEITEG